MQGIGKTDAVAQEFFLVHAQVSGAGGKGFFIWDQERFVGALEAEKLADNEVSAQVIGASEIVDSGREGECGFQMAYHFPHVGNAAIVVDGIGDAAFFTDSLAYAGDKGVVFPGAKLFIVKHPAHAKRHGIGLGSKASLFGLLLLFSVNAAGGEEFVLSVRFLYIISEVYLIRAEKNHPRSSFPAGQGYVFRAGYVYQIRVSGIFVACANVRNSAAGMTICGRTCPITRRHSSLLVKSSCARPVPVISCLSFQAAIILAAAKPSAPVISIFIFSAPFPRAAGCKIRKSRSPSSAS